MKTLSDGTKAKEGLIVVVINGISSGNTGNTVTKITSLIPDDSNWVNEAVECEWHTSAGLENITMSEKLTDLRKANTDEIKMYKNYR